MNYAPIDQIYQIFIGAASVVDSTFASHRNAKTR